MFKVKMWSIRNGVGPRGKSQERFVGQLLGFRGSSTGMTSTESVPALTVCEGELQPGSVCLLQHWWWNWKFTLFWGPRVTAFPFNISSLKYRFYLFILWKPRGWRESRAFSRLKMSGKPCTGLGNLFMFWSLSPAWALSAVALHAPS